MEFPTEISGDKALVKITADLDSEQSGEALRKAFEIVQKKGKSTVVLDLTDVKIINSYGIGKILLCHKELKSKQGTLMVRGPQGFVRETFELLLLDKLVPIEDA